LSNKEYHPAHRLWLHLVLRKPHVRP
jgi:hypothetical protein